MTPETHRGTRIGGGARPNRTWGTGRRCGHPGCGTVLSIYNRSQACSLHEQARTYVVRGRRRPATARGVMTPAAA
jgi:hypothetical protein